MNSYVASKNFCERSNKRWVLECLVSNFHQEAPRCGKRSQLIIKSLWGRQTTQVTPCVITNSVHKRKKKKNFFPASQLRQKRRKPFLQHFFQYELMKSGRIQFWVPCCGKHLHPPSCALLWTSMANIFGISLVHFCLILQLSISTADYFLST